MRQYRNAAQHFAIAALILVCGGCLDDSVEESLVSEGEIPITITAPTATEIDTTDDSIDLAGTATSTSPISSVHWENDRGGEGTANGAENWSAVDIPLQLGTNTITVTATDATGTKDSAALVVNRESTGTTSVTLSWQPPTTRTNGTALTNLAGYRIYYGRMAEAFDFEVQISNPGVLTYMVDGLTPGEWFFAAAAYDASGNESDYSEVATTTIL